MGLNELLVKLKSFTLESRRVLKITKKPTMTEFKTIVKVTGLGAIVIGLVGFVISVIGKLVGIN